MEFNASDSLVDPKSDNYAQPLTGTGNFRNEAAAEGVGTGGYATSDVKLEISLSSPG
jgi:hypothetical protein